LNGLLNTDTGAPYNPDMAESSSANNISPGDFFLDTFEENAVIMTPDDETPDGGVKK